MTTHGFLIAVDVEDHEKSPDAEKIQEKLVESLTWVEGVGKVDITYLGEMDDEEIEMLNKDTDGN